MLNGMAPSSTEFCPFTFPAHYQVPVQLHLHCTWQIHLMASVRDDRRQVPYGSGSLLSLTEAIDYNQFQSTSVTITLQLCHRAITLLKTVKGEKTVIREEP